MDCMALSKWIRWLYFHGLGGSTTMEYSVSINGYTKTLSYEDIRKGKKSLDDGKNKNDFFDKLLIGLNILLKDTFNKLGYKTKINTHTTSCINLFLDIYFYSEYRLIYC